MAEGLRDSFIENDTIGNYATGTDFIGSMARRKSKRKSVKHRKKVKHRRSKARRVLHRRRHSKVRRRSKGGIKYTKKGQPYRIMSNGRARFIKK